MRRVFGSFSKFIFLFLVSWFIVNAAVAFALEKGIDQGLDEISRQITESIPSTSKKTIAVMDFNDLQGNVTLLGRFIGEELITRLFQSKQIEVIERSLLDKAIQELQFNTSDLVDTSNAKQLGRVVGADAIVVGTLTDLGQSVKVNARIIVVESGKVIGAASAQIVKEASMEEMKNIVLGGLYVSSQRKVAGIEKSPKAEMGYAERNDGRLQYYDDFKKDGLESYVFSEYGEDGWTLAKYKINKEAGHIQITGDDFKGVKISLKLLRSIKEGRIEIEFLPTRSFDGEITIEAVSSYNNGYFYTHAGTGWNSQVGKILSGERIIAERRTDLMLSMDIKHKAVFEFNLNNVAVYFDNTEIFSIPNGDNFDVDEIKIGLGQLNVFFEALKVEEL